MGELPSGLVDLNMQSNTAPEAPNEAYEGFDDSRPKLLAPEQPIYMFIRAKMKERKAVAEAYFVHYKTCPRQQHYWRAYWLICVHALDSSEEAKNDRQYTVWLICGLDALNERGLFNFPRSKSDCEMQQLVMEARTDRFYARYDDYLTYLPKVLKTYSRTVKRLSSKQRGLEIAKTLLEERAEAGNIAMEHLDESRQPVMTQLRDCADELGLDPKVALEAVCGLANNSGDFHRGIDEILATSHPEESAQALSDDLRDLDYVGLPEQARWICQQVIDYNIMIYFDIRGNVDQPSLWRTEATLDEYIEASKTTPLSLAVEECKDWLKSSQAWRLSEGLRKIRDTPKWYFAHRRIWQRKSHLEDELELAKITRELRIEADRDANFYDALRHFSILSPLYLLIEKKKSDEEDDSSDGKDSAQNDILKMPH